jgi:putative acetyltransferase
MNEGYTIKKDNLTGPEVAALLEDHLREMALHSPPESIHALDLDALRKPEITFWSVWDKDELVGCGALKQLGAHHAEIKSMRTAPSHRGKGIAKQMLKHILSEAERRGITRLSLETGSMAAFDPARRLYSGFGFVYCDPFADYKEDPNSVFMTKEL